MSLVNKVALQQELDKPNAIEGKKKIKISVIVPVYNTEKYLSKCLDSLVNQTYKNIEIICVNDGSTDHSRDILEFYASRDRRIIVINQENAGPSKARNRALDKVTGDYISFVDSDDFLMLDAYRLLILCAEDRNADIVVFGGNTYPHDIEAPGWVATKLSPRWRVYQDASPWIILNEESATPFLWIHFIKSTLIQQTPKLRFEESIKIGEDQLFQLSYFPRARRVILIEDKLYNYRITRADSLMFTYQDTPLKKIITHIDIVKNAINLWERLEYTQKYEDVLVNWIFKFLSANFYEHPRYRQKTLAKEIFKMIAEYDLPCYLLKEEYITHYQYMKNILDSTASPQDEWDVLKRELAETEVEIQKTLESKSFKVGKILTPKSKRINVT